MYLYEICKMMQELGEPFGFDGGYYAELADNVKKAFIEKFYDFKKHDYGFWGTDGVALALGVYPNGEKEKLLNSLLSLMKSDGYEMPTAMYATRYLVKALFKEGYGDEAYKFLFNENKPSFATMINAGATSVWESLGQGPSNGRDVYVLSYNHPMQTTFLGSCYTEIAGLVPLSEGFKTFEFRPCKPYLDYFSVKLSTAGGDIKVDFKDGEYFLSVPPNTRCVVGETGGKVSVN